MLGYVRQWIIELGSKSSLWCISLLCHINANRLVHQINNVYNINALVQDSARQVNTQNQLYDCFNAYHICTWFHSLLENQLCRNHDRWKVKPNSSNEASVTCCLWARVCSLFCIDWPNISYKDTLLDLNCNKWVIQIAMNIINVITTNWHSSEVQC